MITEESDYLAEYTTLTREEAEAYCAGSEHQRVRDVIAERVGQRAVLDYGCGPGIDAARYAPGKYLGLDVSKENIERATRRYGTGRVFGCQELPVSAEIHALLRVVPQMYPDCVMIKSVLEHTPTVEHALALLRDACRLAREEVFVAWHTPPGEEEVIRRVTGHAGRLVWQNTYRRSAFEEFRTYTWEPVDNFELWTINAAALRQGVAR